MPPEQRAVPAVSGLRVPCLLYSAGRRSVAVTVRLFAALRDAAGTSQLEVDEGTVPVIVAGLCERFSEPFATRVAVASALLNGQPVRLDSHTVARDGSELALLPPFSGGSASSRLERRITGVLLAGSLLVPALLALGLYNDRWAFGLVVIVVGVGSLIDLHMALGDTAARTVLPAALLLAVGPALLVLLAPELAGAWIGGAIALTVVLTFLLTLASPRRHDTAAVVGSTLFAGLLVAFGATALVLLYDAAAAAQLTGVLALIGLTDATVTLAGRRSHRPPVTRLAPAAIVVAALAAAAVWTGTDRPGSILPVAGFALAAVIAALVTGRLRAVLRPPGTTVPPRPALLIGTADAVLVGAPLAFIWLQVVTAGAMF
jgi:molybdopterin converting factor small subunit